MRPSKALHKHTARLRAHIYLMVGGGRRGSICVVSIKLHSMSGYSSR